MVRQYVAVVVILIFLSGCRVISLTTELPPPVMMASDGVEGSEVAATSLDSASIPTPEVVASPTAEPTTPPEPSPTPEPTVPPTALPTATPPTELNADAEIEVVMPTPRAEIDPVRAEPRSKVTALDGIFIRMGPGQNFPIHGSLATGFQAEVLGQSIVPLDNSTWYKIACPLFTLHSECWVTGHPRFVATETIDEIADIQPPDGIIATLEQGNLWINVFTLDAERTDTNVQVTFSDDVLSFAIANDGQKIAFVREDHSLAIFDLLEGEPREVAADVRDYAWLRDSERLVFNTQRREGFVTVPNRDFWVYDVPSHQLTELYGAGEAGATFAISAEDRLLFATDVALIRVNLNGSGHEVLQEFRVPTIDEVPHYPDVFWNHNGTIGFAAIPGVGYVRDLWKVGRWGSAENLLPVDEINFLGVDQWSRQGDYFAYYIAGNLEIGSTGRNLDRRIVEVSYRNPTILGWHPTTAHLLYTTQPSETELLLNLATANLNEIQTMPLEDVLETGTLRWLDDERFLLTTQNVEGNWVLQLMQFDAEPIVLLEQAEEIEFAVWP